MQRSGADQTDWGGENLVGPRKATRGCRCRNGKDVGVGERGCVGEGWEMIGELGGLGFNGPE